jgi:dipeptidyl aminopeptidase/acylaminoacyl peptidase
LWIGNIIESDSRETVLFDPHAAAKLRGTERAFPGLFASFISDTADFDRIALAAPFESASDDFNRIVVSTNGPGDSGTYWIVDIASGSADPIGYPYPDVKPSDVGPIRMVDWKAADGLAMSGVLSLPPGRDPKNLPLVVLPHGGPEARNYPVFDWWAQAFASRGYAVFQPNFRGSSGYGRAFRDAGFGEWGRKMQSDISDGIAELAREGIVDPKRAYIVGGAYGGYAALAGVTVQHGLYRCAVADAGVSDPAGMLDYAREHDGSLTEMRYWKSFMGVSTPLESELNAISPLKLAAHADAPILLTHGKDDTVVPISQSYAMQHALQDAGKPVEMVVMPNEDHWLSREETRTLMLKSAVAFVEKYNPHDPPPAASAAAASSTAQAH